MVSSTTGFGSDPTVITSAYEDAEELTEEATLEKIAADTENAIESMKQQTIGKHISNMVKNSNLISY